MATAPSTVVTTHKGKHEITFTSGNHRYRVDGKYKKGATTILGMLSKDALAQWAANMAVKYIEDNCGLIEQTPKAASYYEVREADLKAAKKYHATFRDSAADVGKAVHLWIENHLQGNDTEITEEMQPSVTSYLAWEAKYKPLLISSERIVYSQKLDLCGTTDLVCVIDEKRIVLDFKTGKPEEEYNPREHKKTGRLRAYTSVFIQDAFYDTAIQEEDGVNADAYAALYLPVTGGYSYFVTEETALYRKLARALRNTFFLFETAKFINEFEEAE